MRVLIDTNVLLDAVLGRQPFFEAAGRVLELCSEQKVYGIMAAHSIPDMFYILRKDFTEEERRDILLNLCDILYVIPIGYDLITSALKNGVFRDFEDCLQSECAAAMHADYIITRNVRDFSTSPIPCLTPGEFLERIMPEAGA